MTTYDNHKHVGLGMTIRRWACSNWTWWNILISHLTPFCGNKWAGNDTINIWTYRHWFNWSGVWWSSWMCLNVKHQPWWITFHHRIVEVGEWQSYMHLSGKMVMENYIYIQPSCTVQRPSTCFVKTGDVEDSKKLKDQDWMIERDCHSHFWPW